MKKIILIAIIFIFNITACFAQQESTNGSVTTYTERVCKGTWNNNEKEYTWDDWNKISPMQIYLRNNILLVFDKAKSSYTMNKMTYSEKYSDKVVKSWRAIDEKDIDCEVTILKYNTGKRVIVIHYDSVALMYELKD